jgi:choice-of-anchor B domain-containing protein
MRIIIFVFGFVSCIQLHGQQTLSLLAHLSYDSVSLAGCWHYVDSTGHSYALVGTSKGLSIVDVSQPTQPFQRFHVPGVPSNWREVKTWGGFAYVGSEGSGSGITIVDLRALPDTIHWKVWKGDGIYENMVFNSHTVQAEDGYLYIFGGGTVTNGATICSLSDPWNPHIVGIYSMNYVHDGFIRGDTLWTSEIYKGQFGIVDISDKTNPQLIITNPTPFAFNHNTWLSDNSKVIFTTDEKSDAPLAAFDVSDLQNIKLLDKYYPSFNPAREVHNVRVHHDFLINPSYGGQMTIVDAHRPENLIETERALMGTSLVWDADPYLPSGIVFATAKAEGLFIYMPTYQRAAYLEGTVKDAVTGANITGAKVEISAINLTDSSDTNGQYKTGTVSAGMYSVMVSKSGYETKMIPGITLQNSQLTLLDVALTPMIIKTYEQGRVGGFQVFPTVFKDVINIKCALEYWPVWQYSTIQLLDLQGNILFQDVLKSIITEVRPDYHLSVGTYIIKIIDKQSKIGMQCKMIKQK